MTQFRNWQDLLKHLWIEGIANLTPLNYEQFIKDTDSDLKRVFFEDKSGPSKVRPSGGVTCPRQVYYLLNDEPRKGFPKGIEATFAMGHLVHNLSYAALNSVKPPGIEFLYETQVDTGFPIGKHYNPKGTIDLICHIADYDEMDDLLPHDVPRSIIGDFKTMAGFAFKNHVRKDFSTCGEPDPWGYLKQLAIYANSPSLEEKFPDIAEAGALLIGINKESPMQGLSPRLVMPEVLAEHYIEVEEALAVTKDVDPGPVMVDKHGVQKVAFYCGASGRKGYCPYVTQCQTSRRKKSY
jgi:hypothetical protein